MKLRINQGFLAAASFLAYLFGGYVALLLVVGFIFAMNQSDKCKKSALMALVTAFLFSLVITIINLLPDILNQIATLVRLFDGNFSYGKFATFINLITGCIGVVRTIVFLLLAFLTYKGNAFDVSFVDKLVEKQDAE